MIPTMAAMAVRPGMMNAKRIEKANSVLEPRKERCDAEFAIRVDLFQRFPDHRTGRGKDEDGKSDTERPGVLQSHPPLKVGQVTRLDPEVEQSVEISPTNR